MIESLPVSARHFNYETIWRLIYGTNKRVENLKVTTVRIDHGYSTNTEKHLIV